MKCKSSEKLASPVSLARLTFPGRLSSLKCWAFIWVLVFIIPLLWAIDDTPFTQLVCEPQEDQSLVCRFRIDTKHANHNGKQYDFPVQHCPEGQDFCVHAAISVMHQFNRPNEDDKSSNVSKTISGTTDRDELFETNVNDDVERDVTVGIATYRPPWSQYGQDIAKAIAKQPASSSPPNNVESSHSTVNEDMVARANWYFELGSAHFLQHQASPLANSDWYQMELALNAFQQAAEAMSITDSKNEINEQKSLLLASMAKSPTVLPARSIARQQSEFNRLFSRDSLLANVYFQMGEAHLVQPEGMHQQDALNCFKKAEALYSELRSAIRNTSRTLFLLHPSDRTEISLRWADACARIGTIIVSQSMMDPTSLLSSAMYDETSDNIKITVYDSKVDGKNSQQRDHLNKAEQAKSLLDDAIETYRSHLKMMNDGKAIAGIRDRSHSQMNLASALQSVASLEAINGNLDNSANTLLEALKLYQEALIPHYVVNSAESISCLTASSVILRSLADTFLQLGRYGESKQYYQQTMDWHERYDIPVATVQSAFSMDEIGNVGGGVDEALQSYLGTLEDYHAMVEGGTGEENGRESNGLYDKTDIGADSGYYYQRDDGYEGDLHSAVGSLYLSLDDPKRARGHLEIAVILYESDNKNKRSNDKSNARSMADVKFNLAIALYRLRLFSDSAEIQFEALDIYEELYGPGLNPLVQGLEEYEQALAAALGVEADFTDSGSDSQQTEPETDEAGGKSERLIDLERFKQMIVNVTSTVADGATPGEEL